MIPGGPGVMQNQVKSDSTKVITTESKPADITAGNCDVAHLITPETDLSLLTHPTGGALGTQSGAHCQPRTASAGI